MLMEPSPADIYKHVADESTAGIAARLQQIETRLRKQESDMCELRVGIAAVSALDLRTTEAIGRMDRVTNLLLKEMDPCAKLCLDACARRTTLEHKTELEPQSSIAMHPRSLGVSPNEVEAQLDSEFSRTLRQHSLMDAVARKAELEARSELEHPSDIATQLANLGEVWDEKPGVAVAVPWRSPSDSVASKEASANNLQAADNLKDTPSLEATAPNDDGIDSIGIDSIVRGATVPSFGEQAQDSKGVRTWSVENTRDISQNESVYTLEQTTWVAATLVGTRILGRGGCVLVLIALLTTVFVQLLLCAIVTQNLVGDVMDENILSGLRMWRTNTAHDVRNLDVGSHTSLASRVCNSDASLAVSTYQQTLVDGINEYLGRSDGSGGSFRQRHSNMSVVFGGPVLCLCVEAMWFLYILVEIRDTCGWMLAFYTVPRRRITRLVKTPALSIRIESITSRRFAFVASLALVRLTIAGFLGVAGVRFLAYETDIGNLLLNAMALTFILDLDELLYRALIPRLTRSLIHSVEPIATPRPPSFLGGADPASLLTVACLIGSLVTVKFIMLDPIENRLLEMSDIVCGGATDFTFALNPSDGIVEWAPSVAFTAREQYESYAEQAVMELRNVAHMPPGENGFRGVPLSREISLQRVIELQRLEVSSPLVTTEIMCHDRIDHYRHMPGWQHMIPMLRKVLSVKVREDVMECSDVREHCDDPVMVEVRSICPITCGCGQPTSGLFLAQSNFGCPWACRDSHVAERTLESLPCADISPDTLLDSLAWVRYWQGYVNWRHSLGAENNVSLSCQKTAMEIGCRILTLGSMRRESFCDHHVGGSLRPFCPEACGCVDAPTRQCPTMCRGANPKMGMLVENATNVSSSMHH